MKPKLVLVLTCLALAGTSFATEDAKTSKKSPAPTSSGGVDISNGTDIIGSKDVSLVLNIVSWKDKENYLPKNPLSASVLQEGLAPIDREVVSREVNYSRALQELSPLTVGP